MLPLPPLLLFLFTTIIILLLRFLWNRRRLYKLSRKIPGRDGLPLLGDILQFTGIDGKDFMDTVFNQMNKDSTLTKFWIGPELILMTEDPDSIHTIFSSPHCINKPKLFYDGLTATKGLLPLTGELYPRHRKLLNRAFMPNILHKIQPVIDSMCKRFVIKMQDGVGKEVNILYWVGACALETFGKSQFGYTNDFYGSRDIKVVDESMNIAMRRITQPWYQYLPEFIFYRTKLGKEVQSIVEYGLKWRRMAFEHYDKIKVNDYESIRNRVVDVLLNPENKFNDIEIRDEFVIFILGSYDTTAKTVSILLLMLAIHQDVQQKLIAEIDEICNKNENFTIDIDFLKNFEYMELIIKETMRLFPAGPSLARVTDAEIEIGGYKVPKDAILLMSLLRMHKNPKYWGSDAHLFKPERFKDELKFPRAYAPFSGGKRMCIGYRYANMFMKTFLIHFFREYQVQTSLKYEDIKLVLGVTINIEQGCMITVKKRNKL